MPFKKSDYSKTVIFKIECKDPDKKKYHLDVATGLKNKVINMKKASKNENNKNYNLPFYEFVRENGGWVNFNVIVIEEYPCENKNEALMRLNYWKNKINNENAIV